jgi:alginate O-acetyltransferase complex protein AlgI
MLFNSWTYLFFLITSLLVFFTLKNINWRVYFICIASVIFYSFWRWEYASIMMFSAVLDFFCSQRIQKIRDNKTNRKPITFLMISLFVNLGLLIGFKYTYFLYDNFTAFLEIFGLNNIPQSFPYSIVLPMGISFYTFQTISYTLDIYRNVYRAESNFFYFLAYVTFWPQLVAGPILRADEIIFQFRVKHQFKIDNLLIGGRRMLFGFFKKVVLADTIAKSVDHIYSINPNSLSALDVLVAAVLFGFQIYFDFAGYSDIAIGSARIMGFNIPENFNWPYASKSPREFWKNWHISLSSWIRDYLYIPLSGQKLKISHGTSGGLGEIIENDHLSDQKTKKGRAAFALFATWFIMGLWHGAGWNFALWGVYHAFFIFLYRILDGNKFESNFPSLALGVNFLICMIGWIPFRAGSINETIIMLSKLCNPLNYNPFLHQVSFIDYGLAAFLIIAMIITYKVTFVWSRLSALQPLRIVVYSIMIFFVLVFLQANDQFIYFQF